ncbi:MAG: alpha/beta fold hydrolase [Ramlibacter sp.]
MRVHASEHDARVCRPGDEPLRFGIDSPGRGRSLPAEPSTASPPACELAGHAARATPVTIDCGREWCAGWYHPPRLPARDLAVVVCPPIGHEAVSGYAILVQLANHLAGQGFPVLRFDYHGTGESAGAHTDGGRVAAWLASVEAAAANAGRLSGASQVALLGVRLGAVLALEVAARSALVENLVLWAPCPSGRSFVRELRMGGFVAAEGSVRAQGYWYSAETLRDLAALDPGGQPLGPGRRVLLVGRDDVQVEQPLAVALRRCGAEVDFRVLPGYSAMLQNGRFAGRVDQRLLDPLSAWLMASPAAAALQAESLPVPAMRSRWVGNVRDSLVRFGKESRLCGVLSEPAGEPRPRSGTVIVFLNAGHAYRVGPHGTYVQLARMLAESGYSVLRMDLAGVGDSEPEDPARAPELYALASVDDVRCAIDRLVALGHHDILLAGLCSGAYLAFQASLRDPRVHGVILMNPRLLDWTPATPGEDWDSSQELYPKPARAYGRALLHWSAWRRLLTGDISLGWIVQRFASLTAARLRRRLRTSDPPEESLLGKMRRLCDRGVSVLLLVADDAESRQYLEFHFGRCGRQLRGHPSFRMASIRDADHTFTRHDNVEAVSQAILDALARRSAARSRADD